MKDLSELFDIPEKKLNKYYIIYIEQGKPYDDFIVWLEKNVLSREKYGDLF